MPTYVKRHTVEAHLWSGGPETDPAIVQLVSGNSQYICNRCDKSFSAHGWIVLPVDKLERRLCPGDWVVVEQTGETYAMSPEAFAQTFQLVEL